MTEPMEGSMAAPTEEAMDEETGAPTEATTDSSTPTTEQSEGARADEGAADGEKAKRGRPRKSQAKSQGIELVLTVSGTAEGTDWRADVTHGSKRVVKGLTIPASAVAAAAKDLHPEIAEAIETVLDAARDRQRSRVEQLQAELAAAQQALAELGAEPGDES